MKKYIYSFLCFHLFLTGAGLAQEGIKFYEADSTVVVTATRVPVTYDNLARSIEVITSAEIEQLAASNVQEVLEYAASVDVRNQAPNGMLADISIRGASYEQTLVLLDGFKINDPQTGHFNFNLPISLSDVARIEILKGPGSRLYGPNAFGGVINIITKKEAEKNVEAASYFGADNLYNGSLAFARPLGRLQNHVSFAYDRSDGYRPNTEFENVNTAYSGRLSHESMILDLNFGYTDKAFGANQFYGSTSELQWEETKTAFASAKLQHAHDNLLFKEGIYWRKNDDHYIWNRERPELYENFHTTDVYGLESQVNYASGLGVSSLGGEISREVIESNNLGDHSRTRTGLFFEHQLRFFERLSFNIGASAYNYSDWGWQAWPGADIAFKLDEKQKIFLSYGRAFRVPTYTEMYYSDPSNRGNSELKAERNRTVELGYNFEYKKISGEFAAFRRWSEDLIDWGWVAQDSLWQVENITRLNTSGFEAGIRVGRHLGLAYTFLDSEKDAAGLISKYSINHFRHQMVASVNHGLFASGLSQSWRLRYEDRLHFDTQFLLDTRIRWQKENVGLFLDVTNIFDTEYNEFLLIPMPRRKFRVGASYRIY